MRSPLTLVTGAGPGTQTATAGGGRRRIGNGDSVLAVALAVIAVAVVAATLVAVATVPAAIVAAVATVVAAVAVALVAIAEIGTRARPVDPHRAIDHHGLALAAIGVDLAALQRVEGRGPGLDAHALRHRAPALAR